MPDTVATRRKALDELTDVAKSCTNCHLYKNATQTVFGSGPITAKLVLVGEQPGDEEDKQGEPFVGPAGKLLRSALTEAEIDPDEVYMTNVVKHFKWKPGAGWRRLHQKPNRYEIEACRPWLVAEFALLEVFVRNVNRVLSRDRIMDLTKGHEWHPLDRTIDNHVARLRKKIEHDPENPLLIKTVRGVGYTFTADITPVK